MIIPFDLNPHKDQLFIFYILLNVDNVIFEVHGYKQKSVKNSHVVDAWE